MRSCLSAWPRGAVAAMAVAVGLGTAHAVSWVKLGETEAVALYLDRGAIERDGTIRRVWEMQDLKAPDPDGVLSRRYQNEYDCKQKMYRITKVDSFKGPQLTGPRLFRVEKPGYWRKIPADGLFVLSYIALCVD